MNRTPTVRQVFTFIRHRQIFWPLGPTAFGPWGQDYSQAFLESWNIFVPIFNPLASVFSVLQMIQFRDIFAPGAQGLWPLGQKT